MIEQLKSDKRSQQKQLIAALKHRHFKRFQKETQTLIKKIEEKKEYQTQTDFLDQHLLYQDLWYHKEWEKHQLNQKELMFAFEALEHYMAFSKVRTISEIETRKRFLHLNEFTYPVSLKGDIKATLVPDNKPFSLRYNFYQFELNPEWKKYLSLKKLILDSSESLGQSIIQEGLIHLNNYLNGQIAIGNITLQKEAFEILKWAADNKTFLNQGKLYDLIFSNTIVFALKQEQRNWAKNYFDENKKYLSSLNKILVVGYLEACMAFASQQFETVITILLTLQPSHRVQYYFNFKSIITRSYFELLLKGELKHQKTLQNELNAFEKGVKRNRKFTKVRKDNYLNYIQMVKQLNTLIPFVNDQEEKLKQLKTKTTTLNPLAQRKWLLEKIDFIENR